jgi:hypothetical protein
MPRVQTPDTGTIGLQPVAQPTNQFYHPEVRQGTGASSDLIGLAQGLSALEPSLMGVAGTLDNWQTQREQALRQQMHGEVQKLGIKNKQDLMAAVKAGKIPWSDNPWAMVGLKESVARVEADRASRELFDQYSRDPIQSNDSPSQVEAWASQKLSPLLQGKDPYEMAVLGPAVEDATNRLVTYHIEQRAQQRKQELVATKQAELSAMLDAVPADATPDQLSAVQAHIAQWADDAAGYIPREVLNATIADTAKDYALSSQRPEVFNTVLGSIKTTGGKTLADTAQNRLMDEEIHSQLTAKQAENYRLSLAQHQQQMKAFASATMDVANAKLVAYRQAHPGVQASFADVGFDLDYVDQMQAKGLDPDFADSLRQALLTREGQYQDQAGRVQQKKKQEDQTQLDQLSGNFMAALSQKVQAGQKLTAADIIPFAMKAQSLGGMSAASDMERLGYDFGRLDPRPESDPEALDHLRRTWAEGKPVGGDLASLWNKLTPKDQADWADKAHTQIKTGSASPSGTASGTTLTASVSSLKDRILYGYRTRANLGLKDFPDSDQYTAAVDSANAGEMVFRQAYDEYLNSPEGQTASTLQKIDTIHQLEDKTAKMFGGPSREEFAKASISAVEANKAKAAEKPVVQEKPTQFPAIEEAAKSEPLLKLVGHPALEFLPQIGITPATLDKDRGNLKAIGTSAWDNWMHTGGTDPSDPLNQYFRSLAAPFAKYPIPYASASQNRNMLNGAKLDPVVAREKAVQFRQALKAQMIQSGTIEHFQKMMETFQKRGQDGQFFITPEEKKTLYAYAEQIQRYALLTTDAGIDVQEAKQMGPGAYMTLPMFATEDEFRAKRDEVAKELGLTQETAPAWGDRQLELIRRIQNRSLNRIGLRPY